jgi:hypothetical protein
MRCEFRNAGSLRTFATIRTLPELVSRMKTFGFPV